MNKVEFKPELTSVQVQVGRSEDGLTIAVRTTPKLETFFSNAAAGVIDPADLRLNRYWMMKDGGYIMNLYGMSPEKCMQGVIPIRGGGSTYGYTLDTPGRRIIQSDASERGNIINLSFLRAVNISKEGIEFSVKGVYTEDQVMAIRDSIVTATNAFYEAFLRPINLTINLQEG